jgi:lipopolysaccharide/colanic/teichoic acid biosynthesis glycosyltransferase
MSALNKRDPFLLFCGDILIFYLSLWVTLLIRYQKIPGGELLWNHLIPFSILFLVWFLVFFIAGLYEKRLIIFKNRLPQTIFRAQIVNSVVAVLFFYFIPYFGITPKTNLFIYLIVSFVLTLFWRIYGYSALGPTRKQNAILIANGQEMTELRDIVNANERYNLNFISSVDLDDIANLDFQEEIIKRIYSEDVSIIAVDFKSGKIEPILPVLYNLIFSGIVFIDMHKIYEDVFDRIPLSLIKYSWFLENISLAPKMTYDLLKRMMDIVISGVLGIISLIVYPFVVLAIKLEDHGRVFITQERIGKNGLPIKIFKFRTMATDDEGQYDGSVKNNITNIGQFLRRTRIDELPQLWNVIKGDVSLIGPRPELPRLVGLYEKEIPYYGIRHLIKPGLSGWALHHQGDADLRRHQRQLHHAAGCAFRMGCDLPGALRQVLHHLTGHQGENQCPSTFFATTKASPPAPRFRTPFRTTWKPRSSRRVSPPLVRARHDDGLPGRHAAIGDPGREHRCRPRGTDRSPVEYYLQGNSILTNIALGSLALTSYETNGVTQTAGQWNYSEIFVPYWNTWKGAGVLNGTTVGTSKYIVALWGTSGALIANSATAGTTQRRRLGDAEHPFVNTAQVATTIRIPPGRYFIGLQMDVATDTVSHVLSANGSNVICGTQAGNLRHGAEHHDRLDHVHDGRCADLPALHGVTGAVSIRPQDCRVP